MSWAFQNTAQTYGNTGTASVSDFALGTVAMETGAYDSAVNIAFGKGTWQDYVSMDMMVAPVGQGKRDLESEISRRADQAEAKRKTDEEGTAKPETPEADVAKKTGARCVHTWGDGGWQEGWIEYHPEQGYNLVTDANGAVTTYYYTPDQLVTQIKDPLGNSKFTEYTEFMEVYREIDEEGYTTGYTYDDRGNKTSIVYPDGTTAMFNYNEHNQLIIAIDPQGNQTVYTYKKNNPLILNSILEPDNSITTFEYNELGLINQVGKEGKKTLLQYDNQNNLIQVIDDKGNQTKWDYDYKGQVKSVKSPQRYAQHFNYDILGRVTTIIGSDQNATQLTYNAYEEVIEAKDQYHHVKFRYTPMGSLAQREENGVKVNFQYDGMEQLLKITNEHNEQYEFHRNKRGDIHEEIGFDDMQRKYLRDNAGKVIKVIRPGGKETEYEYDALGRITRTEHNDGTWETFTYNKNGLLTEARNQNVCIELLRDAMGRVVTEKQTHGILGDKGFEILSEYDRKGNRTALKSSLGAKITNTFDTQGQLEKIQAQSQELLDQQKEAWETQITRNALGQEIERVVTGGIQSKIEYDETGQPVKHSVTKNGKETYSRNYLWNANNRLKNTINQISRGVVSFSYDAFGSLASAKYEDGSYDYKMPDEVGNLYKTESRKDRKYGKGGQLQQDQDWNYRYDEEGNLTQKSNNNISWQYNWNANGMLKNVKKPNGAVIEFEYDALGRRTAKICNNTITRFLWDGNVLLHEWSYDVAERPQQIVNEFGEILLDREEPTPDVVTWVYEEGSFVPSAKIVNDSKYSIISDYIGRPVQAFSETGDVVWETDYDIYGGLRNLKGKKDFIPFRQLGQYEDVETGLYYNRFRYYNCETGTYLSKDPIGLRGNNPNMYAYVHNSNAYVDIFGLDITWVNPSDVNYTQRTVSGKTSNGISLDDMTKSMEKGGFDLTKGKPLDVMDVNGQLESYDNRRLLAAQNAGIDKVPVNIVDPDAVHPDSSTGKTWREKFAERRNDKRNKKAGGVVPEGGLKTKPTICN